MRNPRLYLVPAGTAIEPAHPLNRGLVGWYAGLPRLSRGPAWVDITKQLPAATLSGASWTIDDTGLAVAQFAGSGSGTVADSPALAFGTGDFTVACRVRCDSDGSHNLIGKALGSGSYAGWVLRALTNDPAHPNFQFWPYNSGGPTAYSTTTPVVGQVYHVTAVRSGGTCQIYVNGIADGPTVSNASDVTCSTSLMFGQAPTGWDGVNLNGFLGDVRLYSRALSVVEVSALADQSRRGHPDTLRQSGTRHRQLTASITVLAPTSTGLIVLADSGGTYFLRAS